MMTMDDQSSRSEVRRLATLFGVVYFAQGICQVVLLLNQPIKYYLRQHLNYTADQVAGFMYLAMIPWMIKPLYGLMSDFVPIAGYRRKSYLLIMNLLAAGAFCAAFGVTSPRLLTAALFTTAVGVACSDVVVDALMVESGQRTGHVKLFQGVQWTCISISGILSSLAGGYLCQVYPPDRAYRIAALICTTIAASVAIAAWFLVRESKSPLDLVQLKSTAAGVARAFRSLRLWLVVVYLMLAHFNPGLQTPLYLHQTETLGFSELTYGRLDAVTGIGYTVGAATFTLVIARKLSTRGGIIVGLVAISLGMLSYVAMRDIPTAIAASFLYGVGYMLSALAMLSLAAEACPKRAEGFTFAAIMSALNVAMQGADYVGSYLYEHVLHKKYWPLPVLAAGVTLIALMLVPLLPNQIEALKPTEPPLAA